MLARYLRADSHPGVIARVPQLPSWSEERLANSEQLGRLAGDDQQLQTTRTGRLVVPAFVVVIIPVTIVGLGLALQLPRTLRFGLLGFALTTHGVVIVPVVLK